MPTIGFNDKKGVAVAKGLRNIYVDQKVGKDGKKQIVISKLDPSQLKLAPGAKFDPSKMTNEQKAQLIKGKKEAGVIDLPKDVDAFIKDKRGAIYKKALKENEAKAKADKSDPLSPVIEDPATRAKRKARETSGKYRLLKIYTTPSKKERAAGQTQHKPGIVIFSENIKYSAEVVTGDKNDYIEVMKPKKALSNSTGGYRIDTGAGDDTVVINTDSGDHRIAVSDGADKIKLTGKETGKDSKLYLGKEKKAKKDEVTVKGEAKPKINNASRGLDTLNGKVIKG